VAELGTKRSSFLLVCDLVGDLFFWEVSVVVFAGFSAQEEFKVVVTVSFEPALKSRLCCCMFLPDVPSSAFFLPRRSEETASWEGFWVVELCW